MHQLKSGPTVDDSRKAEESFGELYSNNFLSTTLREKPKLTMHNRRERSAQACCALVRRALPSLACSSPSILNVGPRLADQQEVPQAC